MRAIFMVLTAVGLVLNTAKAQGIKPEKESRFGIGVFAGLNHSVPIIRIPFPLHFDSYMNLIAGVDVNFRITGQSYLHLQPSWTETKNGKRDGNLPYISFNITTLKMPVSYRQYLLPARKTLFLEAGVGYNHIVQSTFQTGVIVCPIASPCLALFGPDRPSLTNAATSNLVGVGVNIQIQRISIPVTLRYERYLSSHTFPGDDYNPPTSVKFENFALTTGVNF